MSLRAQILEAGARLVSADLTDGTSGNISARDGAVMIVTPTGRPYDSLEETDLTCVDLDDGRATGRWRPSTEWRMHAAIYRVRADVGAVIHHHGIWSSAVAVARVTIPMLIDEATDLAPIPTATYACSGSAELAAVVAAALPQGRNAVLLANHGAVAVGARLDEALRRALQVERLAKIFIGARLLGGVHELAGDDVDRLRPFFQSYRAGPECAGGRSAPFEWPSRASS